MLEHAWAMGVPIQWMTGHEIYGDSPHLKEAIAEQRRWYVLAVRTNLTVWLERPETTVPEWKRTSRKPTLERVLNETHEAMPIFAVVASWPESQWQQVEVAQGEKGPRVYY